MEGGWIRWLEVESICCVVGVFEGGGGKMIHCMRSTSVSSSASLLASQGIEKPFRDGLKQ